MSEKILIIAGEASGDMHGSALLREMNKKRRDLEFVGIGGDLMIAEGLNAIYHMRDMAFLGFVEVVKHLPHILRVKKRLLQEVEKNDIKTVILIDYPGFNMNIANNLRKMGLKVIYYISPQIWAWNRGRIKRLKTLVHKMLVVFPFEKRLYDEAGYDVEFVGHPLIERIESYNFIPEDEFRTKWNLDKEKDILLFMPGSRMHEIERIFPDVIGGAEKLANDYNMQLVVACSGNIETSVFDEFKDQYKFSLVKGNTYELLKYSKFGIIKSGTSTLETALFELPFVVVYKTSRLTYEMGKRLIKVDHIAMANIIAGKTVVHELIQHDVNETKIYETVSEILKDKNKYDNLVDELSGIRGKLGDSGASEKAANIIIEMLDGN